MDDLRERVEAVERALTDGDGDLTALAEGAAAAERVAGLEDDIEELREEVADLSAATQAIRGYVGNVRSVNESVEERADAALAAVESLESRLDDLETRQGAGETDPPAGKRSRAERSHRGDRPERGDRCHACGRPAETPGAADGGTAASRTGLDRSRAPAVGTSSAGDTLDGFDPNRAGERVTVREESAAGGSRPEGGSSDDGGLVDRLRDHL